MSRWTLLLFAVWTTSGAIAQAGDDFLKGNVYYMVSEMPIRGPTPVLSVMMWSKKAQPAPRPMEPYNREHQFGKWINWRNDNTCMTTRGLVLQRATEAPLGLQHCTVKTGLWSDPYTGQKYQDSQMIQIDHMVPLKNAYISGAFSWNWGHRCAYANFMANNYHLLAVEGTTNTIKGDSTPAVFMPPNMAYRCQYLANWLKVKLIWRLAMSDAEARAIEQQVIQLRCDKRLFAMTSAELASQRAAIEQTVAHCPANPSPLAPPKPPSMPTDPDFDMNE